MTTLNTFGFEVLHKDPACQARAGRMTTAHGVIETPVFMPVGTQATVKGLTPRDLEEMGSQIILSNTYHLYMRPGMDIIKKFGGVRRFMGWKGPVLTDSGGYQVFSLSRFRKIDKDGVLFRSHFDGSEVFLTPEIVIETQEAIGSDIAMVFDECPPPTRDKNRIQDSMNLTLEWSKRAKKKHQLEWQALFGIVQGGVFKDLRLESLEKTVEIGFPGYACGGLCVGEARNETMMIYEEIVPRMPADKPRYLMGIGTPLDFFESVQRGADMFDCVNPTRYGRNGAAFTYSGLVVVRNSKYKLDERPIQEGCQCYTCQHFSRSYLRHLFNAEEMLGLHLVSYHNVYFFVKLLDKMREAIRQGTFMELKKDFLQKFDPDSR